MPRGDLVKGTWKQSWLEDIARDLQRQDPSKKFPNWEKVQEEFQRRLHDTPHSSGGVLATYFTTPKKSAINEIIHNPKLYSWARDEDEWSLGLHTSSGLPDDSVGACIEVWRWVLRQPFELSFTVRIARWVSKLRWIPGPGGSISGVVVDPVRLYQAANSYAAREKRVEATKDTRGMRSRVLDVMTALSLKERRLAQKLGFLQEWGADDDGVSLAEEFLEFNRTLFDYMRKEGQYKRTGSSVLGEQIDKTDELFAPFGEEGSPLRNEAGGMYAMAVRIARRSPQFRQLSEAQRFLVGDLLLHDLRETYARGEIDNWTPNIGQTIKEASSDRT